MSGVSLHVGEAVLERVVQLSSNNGDQSEKCYGFLVDLFKNRKSRFLLQQNISALLDLFQQMGKNPDSLLFKVLEKLLKKFKSEISSRSNYLLEQYQSALENPINEIHWQRLVDSFETFLQHVQLENLDFLRQILISLHQKRHPYVLKFHS